MNKQLREVSTSEVAQIKQKIKATMGGRISGYIKKDGGVVWSQYQVEDKKFLSGMERDAIAIVHSHIRVKHCAWVLGERGSEWGKTSHAVKGSILLDPETGNISTHSCPEEPQVDFLTTGDIGFSKRLGIPIYLVMPDYGLSDAGDVEAIAIQKPLVWDFFDPTYTTTGKAFVQSSSFRKSDRFAINVRGTNTLSELNRQIAAIASELEERQYAAWERYRETVARCTAEVDKVKAEFDAAKKRSLLSEAKYKQQQAALPASATQKIYLPGAASPIPVEEWLRQERKQHYYV